MVRTHDPATWLAAGAAIENCYLTTTGRRTGRPHEIEIWFGVLDTTLYVVSGNGPSADWYQNLIADPHVIVQVDAERRPGLARVVTERHERERVGDLMGAKYVWEGDPEIGLTYAPLTHAAWCYDVPAVAVEFRS